jgi:peptidoglycan/xylan/chitin deacetylase (PgdA/CDA1 family)
VSGAPVRGSLRVLAYHAFAEKIDHPVMQRYSVSASLFRAQLRLLRLAGYRFVDVEQSLKFLLGEAAVPPRSLLLTFDDCYESLLTVALPILREHGLTGAAFAVSQRLGRANDWSHNLGGLRVPLLDASGLAELAAAGIEIGSHTRTHRPLTELTAADLRSEIAGSIQDLEALGLPRPRLLAYPFGEHGDAVHAAASAAGLLAAFTVDPGRVRPGADPFRVPRIEVWREDSGWALLWKVEMAGRALPAWADSARRLWPRGRDHAGA